jgi:hypothetical protein
VLGDVEPAGELTRVELQLRKRARLARQRSTSAGHRLAQLRVAAERVEQVALPALVEEPLLFVLAVDLDEGTGDVGEARRGHGLVVESRGRAAARGDLSGRDQRLRQAIEERGHAGDVGPVPDQRRCRRGRRSRGPARRSGGSCPRRSRR